MVWVEVEEADLTWVFIVGGAFAVVIAVIILVIWCNVRNQSKLSEEVRKERQKGIMPVWGIKRGRAPIL